MRPMRFNRTNAGHFTTTTASTLLPPTLSTTGRFTLLKSAQLRRSARAVSYTSFITKAYAAAAAASSWSHDSNSNNNNINGSSRDYHSIDGHSSSDGGGSTLASDQLEQLLQGPGKEYHAPTALPPTPQAATLGALMPYLLRLALGEGQLYWRVAGALAALVISKAAGLLAPVYFKLAVDALSTPAIATSSTATAAATAASALWLPGAVPAATAALLVSGLCRALSALAKELQHPLFTPVSQAAGRRVSFYALAHVLGLDLHFHLDRNTGSLSRMLERGARSIAMIFRAVVFTLAPTALELVAVCILLARSFRPTVSLLVVATFVAYTLWTVSLTFISTQIRREVKDLDNAISGRAVDALLNVEAVKLGGAEALEVQTYDDNLTAYQKASVRLEGASAALNAGQAAVLAVGMTAALVAAAISPGVTPGDLVMVQGLLLQLWAPLQFLGWFYRELRQSLVDMEDLFALLRTKTQVPEGNKALPTPPNMTTTTVSSTNMTPYRPPGVRVDLQDVRFKYPESNREVLKGVSISALPGQSIAVVGPSGSGKSTLLRLLVRLFDVHSGSVSLDGEDVRNLKSDSLRAAVAVVPQDTILFNDTILHNVTYGRPGSTPEEVRAATSAAKLDVAVARMSDKWSTLVGERGLKLSGGEKQRVAIARAFLREPRLLICDEATSALDSATERGIMESLKELAAGRTSVFVAHRLSTVQGCDKIYVLKEGKVAEEGTHAELMGKSGGVYRDMWKMQAAQQALDKKAGVQGGDKENLVAKKSGEAGTAVGAVIEGVGHLEGDSSSDELSAELDPEAAAIERSL
ncbi:hypothetical protein Ndes2526B_g00075 [Nannochloris sp. 'desiccata']